MFILKHIPLSKTESSKIRLNVPSIAMVLKLNISITWETLKVTIILMFGFHSPEILIQLLWSVVWASGVFKASQVVLMGSPMWKALCWDPPWILWDFHRRTLLSGIFSFPLKLPLIGSQMGFSNSQTLLRVPVVYPYSHTSQENYLLPPCCKGT